MGDSPEVLVDSETLRAEVRRKYREVATAPDRGYHFHTGRPLTERLGYDRQVVRDLPNRAVESFAGVGNLFSLRRLEPGERVVDVGSGAGFDAFVAAGQVGADGQVVGVDMTAEMLDKSRATAAELALDHVEFREGLAESLPVADGWADVVITNGVLNLCADKQVAFGEVWRVLRPGGWLQFADIATGRPLPPGALRDIDLWTG
ncbi:MAG: methyltransferase domain-containing protein [Actinomycetota bacterium]|nr:methyltransferase domain-containing protein [Actinomycetota bacterium]